MVIDLPIVDWAQVVFRVPQQAEPQRIGMTRRELFDSDLLEGRDGDDMLYFNIVTLRNVAVDILSLMRLTHA